MKLFKKQKRILIPIMFLIIITFFSFSFNALFAQINPNTNNGSGVTTNNTADNPYPTGTTPPTTSNDTGTADTATLEDPLKNETVESLIVRLLTWMRTISVALAVLMVIVGGFVYLTSFGSGQVQKGHQVITGALIGIAVIFIASSLIIEALYLVGGQEAQTTAPSGVSEGYTPLSQIVLNVSKTLAGLIAVIATLVLIAGGIMYLTSAGSSRTETATNIVKYAILGVIVSLLAYSIVSFLQGIFITAGA